ncbi:MAG TPA: flagellar hook-basal body protein [Calditrichia bacterium]|nr:flagellar hook-basal body protein [Calditrichota bacterium]HQV30982.1 flagellar hook-basal body protein [Calditrichia bacterium]
MDITLPKLRNLLNGQNIRNESISNNLANLDNAGFKRDVVFFELVDEDGDRALEMQTRQYTDFSQGMLSKTENPLDLALAGRGFFTVETENGEMLTRDGQFKLDEDGVLRTSAGHPVIGEQGWIILTDEGLTPAEVSVTRAGEIFVDGDLRATLRIQDVEDLQALNKLGDNLMQVEDANALFEVEEVDVQQGFLEDANVNPINEMMGLIEVQRQFESTQKMIQTLDDIFRQAASSVGRVS